MSDTAAIVKVLVEHAVVKRQGRFSTMYECACGAEVWADTHREHVAEALGALLAEVRRETAERIAKAIEGQRSCGVLHRGHDGCYVADSLRIAREDGAR